MKDEDRQAGDCRGILCGVVPREGVWAKFETCLGECIKPRKLIYIGSQLSLAMCAAM